MYVSIAKNKIQKIKIQKINNFIAVAKILIKNKIIISCHRFDFELCCVYLKVMQLAFQIINIKKQCCLSNNSEMFFSFSI